MGLEAASFLNDLVTTNPVGGVDTKAFGDDHLRLIKSVLKATFPLAIGARKFRDDTASAADTLSWTLFRNRNGVANDLLASYVISGNDNAGNETVAMRLQARWDDSANGSEDTSILMKSMVGGVETVIAEMNNLRPISFTTFTANGTWNRPLGCRRVMFEGVAGGAAGGGVIGAAGTTAGAGGGGGPGRYGFTPMLDATLFATAAIVIGLGGVGVSGGVGGNGGNTTVTANAVVYTWNGGFGGSAITMNGSQNQIALGGGSGGSTNLLTGGGGSIGGRGLSCGPDTTAVSGEGGSTPFGMGGYHAIRTVGGNIPGIIGNNFGGGGSGAAGCAIAGNTAGGNGAPGQIKAWEFY